MPSEGFFGAVVAAGDLLATEGGTITFLFTKVRPPEGEIEKSEDQKKGFAEIAPDPDPDDIDRWRQHMTDALRDARDLLYERGLSDDQINVTFADYETPPSQAVADEAAAGAYDLVVLSRDTFIDLPAMPGDSGEDIARAVQELEDDGVRLLVT